MDARRLSVIVPTCNRPKTLRFALESIRAVEGPDLSIEILVCDNGDCQETRSLSALFGAVYLQAERKGASEARNVGLHHATGDFIAFLDDDDMWLETHVRPHLKLFEENPELELVIGQVVPTDEHYKPRGEAWLQEFPKSGQDLLREMLSGYFPQVGCVVVRRSVAEAVGLFDPKLIGGEDLDWLLRIAGRNRVGFVKTPCVLFTHRRTGTFDELQLKRIKFDRLVFNRYAWRWWRLWESPMHISRAYSGTVMNYYVYFVEAAVDRALRGERRAAIGAIFNAVKIFPLRSIKHLFGDTPLRRVVTAVFFSRSIAAQLHHLPLWLFLAHC
ncbi:MAG: glycosyltransferase family A protein [Hyphomonadaceae bacterium]|nr:glycosyltransferase family A protein [Hyphomonadaceae bacterium]